MYRKCVESKIERHSDNINYTIGLSYLCTLNENSLTSRNTPFEQYEIGYKMASDDFLGNTQISFLN